MRSVLVVRGRPMSKITGLVHKARWQLLLGTIGVLALHVLFSAGTSGSYASGPSGMGIVASAQTGGQDVQVPDARPTGGVPRFVHICARTGSPRHPYIELIIPRWALPYFIQHGALYPVPEGGCPNMPEPIPTHVATQPPHSTHPPHPTQPPHPTRPPHPTHVPPSPVPTHGPK